MALPLPPGLTPPEIAFLCEMELVTVIPRQRLEGLELLGVCMPHQHPAAHIHTAETRLQRTDNNFFRAALNL